MKAWIQAIVWKLTYLINSSRPQSPGPSQLGGKGYTIHLSLWYMTYIIHNFYVMFTYLNISVICHFQKHSSIMHHYLFIIIIPLAVFDSPPHMQSLPIMQSHSCQIITYPFDRWLSFFIWNPNTLPLWKIFHKSFTGSMIFKWISVFGNSI